MTVEAAVQMCSPSSSSQSQARTKGLGTAECQLDEPTGATAEAAEAVEFQRDLSDAHHTARRPYQQNRAFSRPDIVST